MFRILPLSHEICFSIGVNSGIRNDPTAAMADNATFHGLIGGGVDEYRDIGSSLLVSARKQIFYPLGNIPLSSQLSIA